MRRKDSHERLHRDHPDAPTYLKAWDGCDGSPDAVRAIVSPSAADEQCRRFGILKSLRQARNAPGCCAGESFKPGDKRRVCFLRRILTRIPEIGRHSLN